MAAPAIEPAPVDRHLLRQAMAGLAPTDEPYAAWGHALGLGSDAVVQRLRGLVSRGLIDGVTLQPLPVADARAPVLEPALIAALADGLPLVPRPFELLGAMLDVPGGDVRRLVQAWLDGGRVRRIAPAGPAADALAAGDRPPA